VTQDSESTEFNEDFMYIIAEIPNCYAIAKHWGHLQVCNRGLQKLAAHIILPNPGDPSPYTCKPLQPTKTKPELNSQ
jgi:hypothetical protein